MVTLCQDARSTECVSAATRIVEIHHHPKLTLRLRYIEDMRTKLEDLKPRAVDPRHRPRVKCRAIGGLKFQGACLKFQGTYLEFRGNYLKFQDTYLKFQGT